MPKWAAVEGGDIGLMRAYARNLWVWAAGFGPRLAHLHSSPGSVRAWFLVVPYHFPDVFLNALRGKDPRLSLSQSLHQDRGDSKLAGLLSDFADWVFHEDGAQILPFGPGTDSDFTLPRKAQVFLTVFWLAVFGSGLWWLIR